MATGTQARTAPSGSFWGTAWGMLKRTFKKWREDEATRLAAALAYYTVFSLPPVLVMVIIFAGFFIGQGQARTQLVNQVSNLIGPNAGDLVQTMISQEQQSGSGALATIVSTVTLLVGATTLFAHLQRALNDIWGVERPSSGIWGTVKQRALSFLLVLGVGLLLLAFVFLSSFIPALGSQINQVIGLSAPVAQILNWVVMFIVVTLLFAALYKFLPDVRIAWGDVLVGAAVTALLFTVGNVLLGLYLGRGGIASTYGAAGALILLLLWVYYSALIFFLGAEFTQVYANRFGRQMRPVPGAKLKDPDKAQRMAIEARPDAADEPQGLRPALVLRPPEPVGAEHQRLAEPPESGYMPPEAAARQGRAARGTVSPATRAGSAVVGGARGGQVRASELEPTLPNWPFEVGAEPGAKPQRGGSDRGALYPVLMVVGLAAGLVVGNVAKLVGRGRK